MRPHALLFLLGAALLGFLLFAGPASPPTSPLRPLEAAGPDPQAPALTPTATVEPELAILQAVINTHPAWYCQGPSGSPGHRQITNCFPFMYGTHPTNGYIDNYGSPAGAQTAWQNRRSVAQSLYPIFANLTYNGYPGYYAGDTAYPYAHYEEYFWGAVWVFGAVSSDDTQYRGAPYIAAAIADAVLAYGGQQGTPTPSTTPTVTPTATASVGPCCTDVTASGATACIINFFDYGFTLNNNCVNNQQGSVTITMEVAPSQSGPWTFYTGTSPYMQTFPPGMTFISGHFNGPAPPQYSWYRIFLHITASNTCWVVDVTAGPQPTCGQPTPPPITQTPSPTAIASVTSTATPTTPSVGGTATPTATACPLQFSDVPPNDPFYAYIRCLACRGILSGYSTSPPCAPGQAPCYNGGANVTRGQVAKIVANAAGFQDAIPSTQQTFADVSPTNPFWVFVERAALHNVISGYSSSPPCPAGQAPCFLPFNNVTRGQMAKIAANAAGYNEPIPSTQQTFSDVPSTNPFWIYVERASGHGVISGYTTSPPCVPGGVPCFLWANNLTRNQAAKIVSTGFYPNCQTPLPPTP